MNTNIRTVIYSQLKWYMAFLCFGVFLSSAFAHVPSNWKKGEIKKQKLKAQLRADCAPATQQVDLAINNVRARLLNGGDLWWDLQEGRFIVPKNGIFNGDEVSSLFAGAVWVGGYDPGGNLKLAALTYRDDDENDFWPGPLTEGGETTKEICDDWDRFFIVTGAEIEEHLRLFEELGDAYTPDMIPDGVKYYPGVGNPFWRENYDFDIPTGQEALAGLGSFWNVDGDPSQYNPLQGDYPVIDIHGCPSSEDQDPQYPDEMIFWIYNDNGNQHTATPGSTPIRMEVQVQAFAYAAQDELNNMTFYRFKLINRAIEDIDDCYFAMWVDPDLGCAWDDYIGCDSTESLMYIYNEDDQDGRSGQGTACDGTPTYQTEIPMLGVDYFRGPRSAEGEELGMSSFTYYCNTCDPPGRSDPQTAEEYYNYLTGRWRDGTQVEEGGDGYDEGTRATKYVFAYPPDDPSGWSMCTSPITSEDMRTIQATGPLLLKPGAHNELIIGTVWVPNVDHPCPSLEKLLEADAKSQALFDNCFDILDGPTSPDLRFIELDQSLVMLLENDVNSNNFELKYAERGLEIPPGTEDSLYRFQGYKVYQLVGPSAENTPSGRKDPANARLVLQSDIVDSVTTIYNWVEQKDPRDQNNSIYTPTEEVSGANEGIINTALLTQDAFTGERLLNHKRYYYTIVAYAFNNYRDFETSTGLGQATPYVEGRFVIGSDGVDIYSAIPRETPYVDLNSVYGQSPEVTKLDGIGVGNNFLRLTEETEQAVLNNSHNGILTYAEGSSPINVKVVNPLDVTSGKFRLQILDENPNDGQLDNSTAYFKLIDLQTQKEYITESDITQVSETLFGKLGISVSLKQLQDAGTATNPHNGAIGSEITVKDPVLGEWFSFITENDMGDYIRTGPTETDYAGIDEDEEFSTGQIPGPFYPFALTNILQEVTDLKQTPAYLGNNTTMRSLAKDNSLAKLKNVDIVFTSNKDLWSRCPIVETSNESYENFTGYEPEGQNNPGNWRLRQHTSVSKNDGNKDGRPDELPSMPEGFGWFPGYAIDVETGERLVVFFGECSLFGDDFPYGTFGLDSSLHSIGADMMFNPFPAPQTPGFNAGRHFVFVTNIPYSENAAIQFGQDLDFAVTLPSPVPIGIQLSKVQWVCAPTLDGVELLSYDEGLIPNETKISMRVDNPYSNRKLSNNFDGIPTYEFALEGLESQDAEQVADEEGPLADVNIVPNPYYAGSDYEPSSFQTTVKITNLPPQAEVTIYSLDGKFIREFNRNTDYNYNPNTTNPAAPKTFYAPDIEWDIKNNAGIPISSGVYLVHIKSDKYGEVVRKWFCVNRQFDPAIF